MKRGTGEKPVACRSCPYGRHQPCIGWCTRKILEEMRQLKEEKRK